MTKKETIIVLFSITFCWSSSYIFIKDLSAAFSAYAYLALTSGIAGAVLAITFRNLFKKLDKRTFFFGSMLAFLIAGNIIFEKMALDHLPASAVSAIATMTIVLVPLILICRRRFPTRNNVAGIIVILLGLYVSGHMRMESVNTAGIIYTLLSCLMMSLYAVFAADYTKEADPLLLTVLQLCVTAVIGLVLWMVIEHGSITSVKWSLESFSCLIIIAFFSKAYAYVMLMYSQKYCDAITVTVVASTEPIVTLILAVLIPGALGTTEQFSAKSFLGAVIIAFGAVVAGTNFLSAKKARADDTAESSPVKAGDTANAAAPAAAIDEAIAVKQTGDTISGNKLRGLRVFLTLVIGFALLGISINVMQVADGYTELRPENFIPVTAGILFGPAAALACAVGNLLHDIVFDFGYTCILGFLGNFLTAYLPYKLWRAVAGETINAHTIKRLLLYIWAAFFSSLATASLLSYGLEIFFDTWYEILGRTIFFNNFVFSIMFGLPSFIVLTSDNSHTKGISANCHPVCGLKILEGLQPYTLILYVVETVLLSAAIVTFQYGPQWEYRLFRLIQWIVSSIILSVLCLIPTRSGKGAEE